MIAKYPGSTLVRLLFCIGKIYPRVGGINMISMVYEKLDKKIDKDPERRSARNDQGKDVETKVYISIV